MIGQRTASIGLDGMPHGLIEEMGQVGSLACGGVFRPLASSILEVSLVAWSSIITGKNPGEHGVFGFTDTAPGIYRVTFVNFHNRKAEPFWNREGGGRAVIINVPTTFPDREMNGVLIAGFVALGLERATYPHSLVPMLREMNYRVDVDSQSSQINEHVSARSGRTAPRSCLLSVCSQSYRVGKAA